MQIVMITAKYLPFIGGAERQIERMSKDMMTRGHQVNILTGYLRDCTRREEANGIDIIRFPFLPVKFLAPMVFIFFCLGYLFWNRQKIDLLHGHQQVGVFTAVIAKMMIGKPVIAHFHGGRIFPQGFKGKLIIFFVKRYVDTFIAVSEAVSKDLRELGFTQNIWILTNGVDSKEFQPASINDKSALRERLELPQDAVIFIFCGRLEPVKGIDLLLKAWKGKASDLTPDLESVSDRLLLILGQGSLGSWMEDFCVSSSDIVALGTVNNVQDYLRAADVFVMPSRDEGTSLALPEAMACSLSVIVTRVGGNVNIIEDKINGILISPENIVDLRAAMDYLYLNEESRQKLGERARTTVMDKFSFANVMDQYEQICQRLTA